MTEYDAEQDELMHLSNTNIAFIGLGNMGSALARSLLATKANIRVWNRSPEKAVALQQEGAIVAKSASEVINGCSAIVVCLSNYAAWKQITENETVREKLSGVTVIQLTGATVAEVQQDAELMSTCGAHLIKGAILCLPEQIGTDDASIVVAGPEHIVTGHDAVLKTMSPSITYLGDNYSAPVVLSRAAISSMLGFLMGTINGATMCDVGGVPLSAFRDQVARNAGLMQREPLRLIDAIAAGNTQETQASLAVWGEGHAALLTLSETLGVETLFHDGIRAMFEKALNQGLGEHDLSAMDQAFRPADRK
ncbi:NAD(P)-binding domain-containing protein [Aliiroseovarius sp. KMU-50]|uniref:NAD(P)-binding domain-containing protein n=1 Tax=Aliiroseovarius salicola TaxID=3009082 RepID=A0ABT4W270_9RHOB|nr:NAD(P)-binding domain-containing protein [Aliiroseovarius sp. KMU-50]MDA5094595.1 NAD(P)-binding domain-containing protein [Aliiroseovarius sp. KMU-50]